MLARASRCSRFIIVDLERFSPVGPRADPCAFRAASARRGGIELARGAIRAMERALGISRRACAAARCDECARYIVGLDLSYRWSQYSADELRACGGCARAGRSGRI